MASETKQPTVEVIVPIYNGEKYLPKLFDSLTLQAQSLTFSTRYLLTPSSDESETLLKQSGKPFEKIFDFNHAKTREKAILESTADIVVLLTQDVLFTDVNALKTLIACIAEDTPLAYLRQKGKGIGVDHYVRHCNYPKQSEVRDRFDIKAKGLDAFFCSDACMAYDVATFKKLNGYDAKALPTNEDMYYARKVLLGGYKLAYCAESFVIHSHRMSLKKIYLRYFFTGEFFKENPEFQEYRANRSGLRLAWSVFWRILVTFNLYALVLFLPDMLARYLGLKHGLRA